MSIRNLLKSLIDFLRLPRPLGAIFIIENVLQFCIFALYKLISYEKDKQFNSPISCNFTYVQLLKTTCSDY